MRCEKFTQNYVFYTWFRNKSKTTYFNVIKQQTSFCIPSEKILTNKFKLIVFVLQSNYLFGCYVIKQKYKRWPDSGERWYFSYIRATDIFLVFSLTLNRKLKTILIKDNKVNLKKDFTN